MTETFHEKIAALHVRSDLLEAQHLEADLLLNVVVLDVHVLRPLLRAIYVRDVDGTLVFDLEGDGREAR